jgi:hypothetical protein
LTDLNSKYCNFFGIIITIIWLECEMIVTERAFGGGRRIEFPKTAQMLCVNPVFPSSMHQATHPLPRTVAAAAAIGSSRNRHYRACSGIKSSY